ncbi:solute carrier organic anion transporter family member 1C1-like [Hemiscyllium ocellatum]|uniref:solute carrier organic anion transporter family member 1C1-like n=1 Tax=Hemiscyllium ocellatum TaxID=170820 RepID=UPI002966A291|nr:solute carrier organic anion transporter family member 1C1-like [Hemiscyllium ocellatum]
MESTRYHPKVSQMESTQDHSEPSLRKKAEATCPPLKEDVTHQSEPSRMEETTPLHPESSPMENVAQEPKASAVDSASPHSGPLTKEDRHSCFNNVKLFLAALTFAFFAKALSGSYMKSTITQMERRFNIPSSLVGITDGSFEIGNLTVIAFVSHFGAKFHRPKLIATGMVLMAIGSFIITLPHFIMGRYEYESAIKPSHNSTLNVSLCSTDPYDKLTPEFLNSSSKVPKLGCEKTIESSLWVLALLGNLIRGIGETPVIPLGISYLDDHAKQENFVFYLGCMYTFGLLGPLFGFVLGSFCAKLFVDIGFVSSDSLTITPKDSRWVGAWWLGFLIAGMLSILAAIPICFFPKSMPREGEGKTKHNRSPEWSGEGDHRMSDHPSQQSSTFSALAKGFLPSVKRLCCNPIYVLLLMQGTLLMNNMIGTLTFKPKFMEQQYGQTTSRANLLLGLVNIPPMAIGIFCGGLVMKRFKLNVIGAAKFCIGTAVASWMLLVLYFTMGCQKTPVAGLTASYVGVMERWDNEHSLFSQCNTDCMCSSSEWEPVCAGNGLTYVSPCLAGCNSSSGTGLKMEFHNCRCVSHLTAPNSSVVLGQCPKTEDCNKVFPYYLAVTILESFTLSFGGMAEFEVLIRSIDTEMKPLAIGIYSLMIRMFAGIPAPIYFGALIDTTCLKWGTNSCGRRGACRLYDTDAFRYVYLGMPAGIGVACFALFIPFFMQVKKRFAIKDEKAFDNVCTELDIINEDNDRTGCDLSMNAVNPDP